MKKLITLAAGALLFASQPVAAQGILFGAASADEQEIAEPLTPEQEARLPAAYELYDRMMPDGFFGQVMASITGVGEEEMEPDASMAFWETFGTAPEDLVSDEGAVIAALDIADPAWRERQIIPMRQMRRQFEQMGAIMNPLMRDATAEGYAIYYTDAELAEVNAFLATPTGAKFLGQQNVMQDEPRMTEARIAQMEAAQEQIAAISSDASEDILEIPVQRDFSELSDAERQQLASLLGVDQTSLEEMMSNMWGYASEEGEWEWEEDETYAAEEAAE